MHVLVRGRVSLYEPRGDYQFIVDHIEEAGEGALRRRFELLKAKLAAEGLFATERKRPLPRLPRQDRRHHLADRRGDSRRPAHPATPFLHHSDPDLPGPVQGAAAAAQIAATIRLASARAECDVLILARGGGSLEDLWAFNEESRRARDRRLRDPDRQRHRPRGRLHDRGLRCRRARADAVRRRRTRRARLQRVAAQCAAACAPAVDRADPRRSALAKRSRLPGCSDGSSSCIPACELRQRAQRLDELEQRLMRIAAHGICGIGAALLAQHCGAFAPASPALRVAAAHRPRSNVARAAIATHRAADRLERSQQSAWPSPPERSTPSVRSRLCSAVTRS